jgi:hypothetical protein
MQLPAAIQIIRSDNGDTGQGERRQAERCQAHQKQSGCPIWEHHDFSRLR